jgi:hypothetical protein
MSALAVVQGLRAQGLASERAAAVKAQGALAEQALLARGQVRHHRLRPRDHAFTYATYFLMLPLRSAAHTPNPALRRNRFGLLSFHDRDHGDGRADALAWLDELLQSEGVMRSDELPGEAWLQTYPRVLGYVFKPVSFWHCHRADGSAGGHRGRGQQHLWRTPLLPAGRARTWPTAAS